jgi:hypothetical protein
MSVEVNRFNCPNCGAPLDIRTMGRAKSIVCNYCHSQIDLTQPPYQVVGNVGERPDPVGTPFQLGMQGAIGEDTYQIIGRVRYRDEEDVWDEWLILSRVGAYRWISDSEDVGLVLWYPFNPPAPINPMTIDRGGKLNLGGMAPATVRSRGTARIDYIEGELTWRATVGDTMNYAEAVGADGTMYSVEWTASEVEFYGGQKLDRNAIHQSFGIQGPVPMAAGAGSSGSGCGLSPTMIAILVVVVIIICIVMSALPSSGYGGSGIFIGGGSSSGPSIRTGGGSSGSSGGGGK